MVYIGAGNTGATLAYMADENAILFSTATQDTSNFPDAKNIFTMSEDGASKRFKQGEKIWTENEDRLRDIFSVLKEEKVVVFSSLGGGSGSSSLQFISKILVEFNCKVLVVGVLPYRKEINPPLANSVQAINSLMSYINKVSVMIFDNNDLVKRFENNWKQINEYIITRVDQLTNMLEKYTVNEFSPVTIDQSELESVVFGGGFVDLSTTFLEEDFPKFDYGYLDKKTKNCMIAMFVDRTTRREKVEEYHTVLTNVVNKISSKVSNARMIPGILRGEVNYTNSKNEKINDRAYVTIASGLSIEKYMKRIEKLRDEAVKKAEAYAETEKSEKLIAGKETKILDI
jgi:hypothetical protein